MRKYDNFCKALENLGIGAELEEPYSVVEQTGIAALFGICFEQSWKLMKALLEESGRTEQRTGSPRAIIKTAYECGLINDREGWLELLETRNILAHSYSDEDSLAAIRSVKSTFLPLFRDLKDEIVKNWSDYAADDPETQR